MAWTSSIPFDEMRRYLLTPRRPLVLHSRCGCFCFFSSFSLSTPTMWHTDLSDHVFVNWETSLYRFGFGDDWCRTFRFRTPEVGRGTGCWTASRCRSFTIRSIRCRSSSCCRHSLRWKYWSKRPIALARREIVCLRLAWPISTLYLIVDLLHWNGEVSARIDREN